MLGQAVSADLASVALDSEGQYIFRPLHFKSRHMAKRYKERHGITDKLIQQISENDFTLMTYEEYRAQRVKNASGKRGGKIK